MYLIFGYLNGYFEKINENKYLTLAPTNEIKKKKKYEELWNKIRDLIRSVIKNSDDYDDDENYIIIKFDSGDELRIKFQQVQNHCILGSIKWMDLLLF